MVTIPFPGADPAPEAPPSHGSPRPAEPARRRGAPLGNRNARKHGIYARERLTDIEEAFDRARGTVGCIDEIALLRIRIKMMVQTNAPHDQFLHALEVLNRLLITHHKLMHPEGDTPF